jgi:hypothetical protein
MRRGRVVGLERIDGFEEWDGATVGRECGTDDENAVLLDDIGPVDEDERVMCKGAQSGSARTLITQSEMGRD